MKYRLAVFDMDGTILNTLGDISASVNFALRAEHMPERTMAEIRGFVGNGVRRLIELSVPSDASQEACESVYNAFAEHYRLHCADATAPYSGIVDLLSRLRAKGMHTAVVSNKPDDAVKALCVRYFNGLFDAAVGVRDGVRPKPCPDAVCGVLDELHIERAEAVYIGDTEVDAATAENAGLDFIAVDWGFRERPLLEKQRAQLIASTADELFDALTQ